MMETTVEAAEQIEIEEFREWREQARLFVLHWENSVISLARSPTYLLSTVGMPIMFFYFFIAPRAYSTVQMKLLIATFAAFGVLAVVFVQFGSTTSRNRESSWERFLRTLPIDPAVRLFAGICTALTFSVISITAVTITAMLTVHVVFTPLQFLTMLATLLVGAVPFGLLAFAIAYWVKSTSVTPVMNTVYLLLALVGLWDRPLPGALRVVGTYLPTHQWMLLVWYPLVGRAWPIGAAAILVAQGLAFGILARQGFKRGQS
ncbi:MAG TPA: hypothetical protein VGL78_10425 [Solirubrobacteraceae bacterium]|jgi:ABC-2 type transport system permease protein